MCVSVAALGAMSGTLATAASAASAIMGVVGAANEASVQSAKYLENITAAGHSAMEQSSALLARQRADAEDASLARRQSFIEGMRAQGTALASSQNEGISENLTLQDLARQTANNITTTDITERRKIQQSQEELNAIQSQYANRVAQVSPGDPNKVLSSAVSGLGNVFGTLGGLSVNSGGHDISSPIGYTGKAGTESLGTGGFFQYDTVRQDFTTPSTRWSHRLPYGGTL